MILKNAKISADVVFEGNGFYTNKLFSRETSIEIGESGEITLVLDYSHYCRWNSTKRTEPEFSDYTKLENHVAKVKKIWINDSTIVKKLQDRGTVKYVKFNVSVQKCKVFPVKAQNYEGVGILLLEV